MQLLFEEFFRKVSKIAEGGSWFFKISIKVIVYALIAGIFILLVYSFLTGNYIIVLILLGIVIVAEGSHYIRKSREKAMIKKATEKSRRKEHAEELLKPQKAKNKSLLKLGKSKNKGLLRGEKAKNKELLRE